MTDKPLFEVVEQQQASAIALHERAIAKAKEHRDNVRLQKLLTQGAPTCGVFFHEDNPEKSHGRIEIRKCTTISARELPMAAEWRGVKSLVQIERERMIGEKTTYEKVYYISSLDPKKPEIIASTAREHWGVESGLHWRLDVVFRQDQSRYRNRIGARNLAAMRKIVLNALSQETSMKGGMATRQFAAACNPVYRDKVIKNLF